ncbi:hypothetical protein K438DRAFT_1953197 [Mycena galopus ATCC 62051]|nr:hypothetical protein K438DRAFT_1953197 [Mycena galopus ATCC 62051]
MLSDIARAIITRPFGLIVIPPRHFSHHSLPEHFRDLVSNPGNSGLQFSDFRLTPTSDPSRISGLCRSLILFGPLAYAEHRTSFLDKPVALLELSALRPTSSEHTSVENSWSIHSPRFLGHTLRHFSFAIFRNIRHFVRPSSDRSFSEIRIWRKFPTPYVISEQIIRFLTTSIPRLDYSTGILTTPFRDFRHIVPTSAIPPEYSAWLLVQLPAHPDVSVSHPVGTLESSVHLRSSPAFILSIPAIFEHSRPTLIMTYVLGDAPFLRMNFQSTLALALNSISSSSYPDLFTITIRLSSGFPIILRPSITLSLPSLLTPSSILPRQSSGLFPDIPIGCRLTTSLQLNVFNTDLSLLHHGITYWTSDTVTKICDHIRLIRLPRHTRLIRLIQHIRLIPSLESLEMSYSWTGTSGRSPAILRPFHDLVSVSLDFLSDLIRSELPSTSGLIPHLRPFLDFNFSFPSLCQFILLRTLHQFISAPALLRQACGNYFQHNWSLRLIRHYIIRVTVELTRILRSGELPMSEIYFAPAARPILLGLHISGIALDLRHFPKFPTLAR